MPLHFYQERGVEKIIEAVKNRFLISFDTGLGKTATAISAAKTLNKNKILVVCPALVRTAWCTEFDRWWPDHPALGLISQTKARVKGVSKKQQERNRLAYEAPIQIVSYDLLTQVDKQGWDFIVFDEIHRLKNAAAVQTKAAFELACANPETGIVGLSGTLIPDKVEDIWSPTNVLWPQRLGKADKNGKHSFQFKDRYLHKYNNGYGWSFEGLKEENFEELKTRIELLSYRVTREEVAHLLPPFDVKTIMVEPSSGVELGIVGEPTVDMMESVLALAGKEKIDWVRAWVDDLVGNNVTHIGVLTYGVELSRQVTQKIQQDYSEIPVYCINGEDFSSPERRVAELQKAKAAPKAIVVMSMKSIGIGIDLTWLTQVAFIEFYWRLETMLQVMGRFSRLSGKVPTSMYMLVLRGTVDERIAMALQEKVSAANSLISAGASSEKLEQCLQIGAQSEEALMASMLSYFNNPTDDSDVSWLDDED